MEEPPVQEVLFYPEDEGRLRRWGLALESRRIPHAVEWRDGLHLLVVPLEYGEAARQELSLYDYRNIDWPPRPARELPPSDHKPLFTLSSLETGIAAALVLAAIHLRSTLSGEAWRTAGVWNAEKIRAGEVWRLASALVLHADIAHLLANLFWIGFMLALLGVDVGGGIGVLSMVVAGLLANGAMVMLGAEHSSLGASTMVFGLLGLICTLRLADSVREWRLRGGFLVRMLPWMPLFIGCALFAFYGTAPGSDVLAHLCGLVSGLLTGVALLPCRRLARRNLYQLWAGVLALGVVAAAILRL